MSREHHSKTKLVYFNSGIRPNLYAWGNLEAHPEWTIPGLNTERALKKWEEYQEVLSRCGKIATCVGDRWNEHQLFYNMDCSWLPPVEYKYHDDCPDFYDVMMKSAEWVASNGNQIDFMWSGGLDSTSALLALNEVCPKQLRVILNENSKLEYPGLWKSLVQHLDHIVDNNDDVLGVADPSVNTWVNCSEADALFGSSDARPMDKSKDGKTLGEGAFISNPWEKWKDKYRYGLPVRTWRMLHTFKGNWLDVNNIKPLFCSEWMQKFACNLHVKDEIVWYTNSPAKPAGEHYLTCKMDLRHFVAKVGGDKEYAYGKLKMNSLSGTEHTKQFGAPLSGQWQLRVFEEARAAVIAGKYEYLPDAVANLYPDLGIESVWPVYAIDTEGNVYGERNLPMKNWNSYVDRKFVDQDHVTWLNPEMFDD
jgi:hypothetical protein